jgi:hypothetical protein
MTFGKMNKSERKFDEQDQLMFGKGDGYDENMYAISLLFLISIFQFSVLRFCYNSH